MNRVPVSATDARGTGAAAADAWAAPRAWGFDALVHEALTRIPGIAPAWTDHNPSDPGITLIELLAFFTEMLAYRVGRVTPQSRLQFLRLLKGVDWTGWVPLQDALAQAAARPMDAALAKAAASAVDEAVACTARALVDGDCAVTSEDFEGRAVAAARAFLADGVDVSAQCRSGRPRAPLPAGQAQDPAGHVTVIVVPKEELPAERLRALCEAVRDSLLPRCLLTTRLHVIVPAYVHLSVGCQLGLRPGVRLPAVIARIDAELRRRFGPAADDAARPGGAAALGGAVRLTEIAGLIDEVDGVDFVDAVTLVAASRDAAGLERPDARIGLQIGLHATLGQDARFGVERPLGRDRLLRRDNGALEGFRLESWEVASVRLAPARVQVAQHARAPADNTTERP